MHNQMRLLYGVVMGQLPHEHRPLGTLAHASHPKDGRPTCPKDFVEVTHDPAGPQLLASGGQLVFVRNEGRP